MWHKHHEDPNNFRAEKLLGKITRMRVAVDDFSNWHDALKNSGISEEYLDKFFRWNLIQHIVNYRKSKMDQDKCLQSIIVDIVRQTNENPSEQLQNDLKKLIKSCYEWES